MPEQAVLDSLLSALSMRDFARFRDCLAPTAQARFLLPRGPVVRSGRDEIVQRFKGWFSRASDWEVLETRREPIGHRNRLSWRFRMRRDGQSKEVIELVAFVDVGPVRISEIDLVCSGFLKEESRAAQRVLDAGTMGCADGLAQEFRKRLAEVSVVDSIAVIMSDPAAKEDLPSLARLLGQSVKSVETKEDNGLVITVEKRRSSTALGDAMTRSGNPAFRRRQHRRCRRAGGHRPVHDRGGASRHRQRHRRDRIAGPKLSDLFAELVRNNGKVWLCGVRTKPRLITEDQLSEGAAIFGAAKVVEEVVAGARTIAFA